MTEVVVDDEGLLPEIEHRLDELDAAIRNAPDRDARRRLQEQQDTLLDLRDEKRSTTARTELRAAPAGFFDADWAAAETVQERRAVLDDALERITVRRGRTGRGLDKSRLKFSWIRPDEVGPAERPEDRELAAWAQG